jgi:endonuclease YncB( thermonuclease family)
VKVQDGDTLTVLVGRKQVTVRLAEIDAPERKQAFGARSRQSLSELCGNRDAVVREHGVDRFGRTLARISCAGVDVNAEQVRRGMAWVFDRYVTDRSLYQVQDEARAARRGLWADPHPVAPWEWRASKR